MRDFIVLSNKRQRLIYEQAQSRTGLPSASLEKDFWVCWTLNQLFYSNLWGQSLTFKGGTSLSKCWGLIDRFSEDIDIVIDRTFLGFSGELSPESAPSRKKRKRGLEAMKLASQQFINNDLREDLLSAFTNQLPLTSEWKLDLASTDEDPTNQTLLFYYPGVLADKVTYIRPVVKIEMGARSDNEPVENCSIHPYLSDVFTDLFNESATQIRALSPERTFWEKAMLLHEETHRPREKKRKLNRMARHYYDLWCLITRGIAQRATTRMDIFERTAFHREIYFRWTWMDYSTLKKGTLRLIPSDEMLVDWRKDYEAMKTEMFFGDIPTFDEVIKIVLAFQDSFNGS